jgi:integrase
LALLVQIYLGLRPGEVLGLQVEAIERQGTKVSIARGKTKNAKRSLELYPDVAVLLWKHCAGTSR